MLYFYPNIYPVFFMNRFLLIVLLFLLFGFVEAQPFSIDSTCQRISLTGDELFPKWSDDGSQLLFQANQNGNWDLFLYDLEKDSLRQLTIDPANEQHPVWVPGRQQIVFDSDRGGIDYLYRMDLESGEVDFLFRREIVCREASFTPSKRLVYFSGFDPHSEAWDIYSYDFVSDNLNHLTRSKGDCMLPSISPDGKQVLFQRKSRTYPYNRLALLNWYGNPEGEIDSIPAMDPAWGPGGLKIYFVSGQEDLQGEVYSIWKDGTHLARLAKDGLKVRTPAVSPDGTKIALAVLQENSFDIFIISLDEY
jgi:Tol biopolymer transport system component